MSATFIDRIKSSIAEYGLIADEGASVIVALSGGADSVALLTALSKLGYHCIAAHCNFHLRGEESDRDMLHARDIARTCGAIYEEKHFDVEAYKQEHGVSTEMACRELRYDWFRELSMQYGGIPVAVAHHHDDNVETMLLNLLRGTGITGLTGMHPRNGIIIRPMLDVSRRDIEQFLEEECVGYVIDSTNMLCDVKRNKLRNIIIPEMHRQFPEAEKGFDTTIRNLSDNLTLFKELLDKSSRRYFIDELTVNLRLIMAEIDNAESFLFETIRDYGFNRSQVSDMCKALTAKQSGCIFTGKGFDALLDRDVLKITPRREETGYSEYKIVLNDPATVPDWLDISTVNVEDISFDRNGMSLYLSPDVLTDNPHFTLRHWREGDRIEPYGMKGSRLVSDIFSDAKLSVNDKKKVWILTRNNVILWVIGHRTSRHFSIDRSQDKTALRISVRPQ